MATVHGPTIPQHPTRMAHGIPQSRLSSYHSSTAPAKPQAPADPFYGHEFLARLSARFITNLFSCPEYPPQPSGLPPSPSQSLPRFIAYALHRTKLDQSVTFAALFLLRRLKARFPSARGSSGHRLYLSAFMIASKVICDDTYSNKSWGIVAQGMFSLREINQMEREMCSYLDWELTVDAKTLKTFEVILKKAFGGSEASKLSTSSPTSSTNSPMRGSLSYHRTCGGAGGGQLSQSQVLSAAYYDEAAATRLSSPSSLHPPENPLSSSIPSLATTNKFSPSPSLLVERGEWQKDAHVLAYVDTALSYLSTLAPMEDALRDQLCDTMLAIVSTSPYHDDGALRSAYSMRAMTQDLIESHGRLPLQAAAYAERPYRPLSPCLVHEDCVESDSLVSSLADLQSSPTGGTITPSASLEEPTGGNPFPTATPLIAYPPRSWSRGADAPVPVSVQGLLRHITGIPLDVRQHLEEGMPRRPSWEKANPKLLMSALVLLLTLVGTVVAILSLQAAKGVNNESKQ